jgi:membrane protease YdiL (CAAX protease family)
MSQAINNPAKQGTDKATLIALFASLVAYPLLYSTDFFGNLLLPLLPKEFITSFLDESTRIEWWYFHLTNFVFHWTPFLFVWMALKKNRQGWDSIGVNWQWFVKYKGWFVVLFVFLIVSAFLMPDIHYGDQLPTKSQTHFILGPVSTVERLFMIITALTAAVTEEVLFRGFALTRLKRWISNPWFILPITVVSFVLIHGEPRSVEQVLPFVIGGIAFGVPFILMGLKRLEIMILIHFFIDAGLVLAP